MPIRRVGIDPDNKTGKYKIEVPKAAPNSYKENVEVTDVLELLRHPRDELQRLHILDVREPVEIEM